ncbi:putative nuclease HARBI1 [Prorops nasuta]|uniref:putative nuclease HARBI1 n=1 Tax=Prorops nasuta TaxID=863751 RepID=UPI0034CF477E
MAWDNLELFIMNEDSSESDNSDMDGVEDLFLQNTLHKNDNIGNIIASTMGDVAYTSILGFSSNGRRKIIYNSHYFEEIIPNYQDDQFYSHFRMNKETFLELEKLLMPHISKAYKTDPRKKILLTIWILTTPESFRSVSDRFGFPKSIGWLVFKEVVWALKKLMPSLIKWPNNEELLNSERIFIERSQGFKGVIGAIDGCHIPIKQPPRNPNDYFNRKDFHSVVLQGTCDASGKFIDCLIGRPGRAHDAAIFRSSAVYIKLTHPETPLLAYDKHLLGDSAYPLLINLMTPFKDNGNLSAPQINYNIKHASLHSIIERAYGLLKGKWRRLKYLDVRSIDMANHVIAAACVLHNFLIINDADEQNENAQVKRNFIMNML